MSTAIRMIKSGSAAALLIGAAGMGWSALRDRDASTTAFALRRQALADDLGSLIARQIAGETNETLGPNIHTWSSARDEAAEVRVESSSGEVLAEWRSSALPQFGTDRIELSLLRDGQPWGRATLTLRLPGDRIARAVHAMKTSEPWMISAVICGISALGVLGLRHRSRGMGGQWAAARERVQGTLDFLAEGVLILDTRGRIVYANRSLLNAAGTPIEALQGQSVDALALQLDSTESQQSRDAWWQSAFEGRTATLPHSGDQQRSFVAACLPIRRGRRTLGTLVALSDVTELERNRVALRAARETADRANEAKGAFLANMSHEIRTPINGVLGSLELLGETTLVAGQRRYVDAAQVSASTLLHLINDILDLSKIDAGKLELHHADFDLEECFATALGVVADAAASKGVDVSLTFENECSFAAYGDGDRLRQVLLNLASNAVKFTERGSVRVSVGERSCSDSQRMIEVAVADSGIGIPPDRLDRLFKSFSQVDSSTSRRFGGTGLGLHISLQLCRLMGGSIRVESEPGKGSTFIFQVRLGAAESTASVPAELLGRSCIICDSCATNRAALAASLRRLGLTVVEHDPQTNLADTVPTLPGTHPAVLIVSAIRWSDRHSKLAREFRTLLPDSPIIGAVLTQPAPALESAQQGIVSGWVRRPATTRQLGECLLGVLAHTQAHGMPRPKPPSVPTVRRGVRVLIAEDHPIGQMISSEAVKAVGLAFQVAATGPDALKAAASGAFGIVLMDCHLPELDGFEVTKRLRALEELDTSHPRPRIIALTANAMAGDKERCLAAGMDAYLSKPIQRRVLMHMLAEQSHLAPLPSEPATIENAPATQHANASGCGIDLNTLSERCMNQRDFIDQMLELFRQTTTEDLAAMADSMRAHDAQHVAELAHRIAGCAYQVGANRLADLARAMESNAAAAQETTLAELSDEFARCVEMVQNTARPPIAAAENTRSAAELQQATDPARR